MNFNKRADEILKENEFVPPVGTNNRPKAPNSKKHGRVTTVLNTTTTSPAAHSGFKGDTLNPAMTTLTLPLPKGKTKYIKRSARSS